MLAYIVVGLILGALAWQWKHEPGDPRPAAQFLAGVGGAVVGGVVANLVQNLDLMAMNAWGFLTAIVVALITLAVLQVRVG